MLEDICKTFFSKKIGLLLPNKKLESLYGKFFRNKLTDEKLKSIVQNYSRIKIAFRQFQSYHSVI